MSSQPHVVIIMADQLRWDALGAHTPAINKLVEESLLFERGYCASPLCVPARGAFFTGRYPNSTGSIINPWEPLEREHGDVRSGIPNLYTLLETEWDSHHVGKQHLYTAEQFHKRPDSRTDWSSLEVGYAPFLQERGHRRPGGPRFRGTVPEMVGGRLTRVQSYSTPAVGHYEPGFDSFTDGYIANCAVNAISTRDRSRPLLLNAMFVAPHPPYDIPEPYYSMIDEVELPENVGRWYPDQSPLQLYNLTGAIGVRYTIEEWRRAWQVYLGLVALLDRCVAMIVAELEAQSIYEESLIVFCADHGEMLGSHQLFQKMCMYEPSVLTPIAFKLPAGSEQAPRTLSAPVNAIDVMPTILDLLQQPVPDGTEGQSLVPQMRGSGTPREDIFIQFDGNGARGNFQRAVVRGSHKLIVDLFKDECFLELYDVVGDPQESVNLAFNPAFEKVVEELVASLRAHMQGTQDLLDLPADLVARFLADYRPLRGEGGLTGRSSLRSR